MPLDPRLLALQRRADRALGSHAVKDAVDKVKAIIGPRDIPDSEAEAQAGLDALRRGDEPTPMQLEALSIVVRLLRPVMYVRQGRLDDLPDDSRNLYSQEQKDRWSTFRTLVQPLLLSVGRINNGLTHVGTGFLVADGLLATNRHVLAALTSGSEVLRPAVAKVVFSLELNVTTPGQHVLPIDSVAAIHPTLDMVLLRVTAPGRPAVRVAPTPASADAPVVAIGFPGKDPVNNPLFLSGVFGNGFGVKRAALGEVLDGTAMPTLFHDCSTTQGNSGSPVFDVDTGHVVAIHRAGFFMYRNEAVDGPALLAFISSHL
jgi:S1-C subfamily serine protease